MVLDGQLSAIARGTGGKLGCTGELEHVTWSF